MSTTISPNEEKVKALAEIQKPLRAVFFGTPDFARTILEELIQNSTLNVVAVVTAFDKPKNRGQQISVSPVKKLAQQNNIKILHPTPELIHQLKKTKADIFITAAYGQILPKEILEIPPFGALNVHGSLLPKYRGASPIQAAILNGDQKTGVSIILMTEGLDEGPIILQKETNIQPEETFKTLHDKLAKLGAAAVTEAIQLWTAQEFFDSLNLKIIKSQDNLQATYTKKITKKDGQIDWQKSATKIQRQVRAFNPWPGSFFKVQNKTFKVLEAEILREQKNPGWLFLAKGNQLAIGCKKDSLIIKKIQPEGKRVLNAKEFINGYKNLINQQLK